MAIEHLKWDEATEGLNFTFTFKFHLITINLSLNLYSYMCVVAPALGQCSTRGA